MSRVLHRIRRGDKGILPAEDDDRIAIGDIRRSILRDLDTILDESHGALREHGLSWSDRVDEQDTCLFYTAIQQKDPELPTVTATTFSVLSGGGYPLVKERQTSELLSEWDMGRASLLQAFTIVLDGYAEKEKAISEGRGWPSQERGNLHACYLVEPEDIRPHYLRVLSEPCEGLEEVATAIARSAYARAPELRSSEELQRFFDHISGKEVLTEEDIGIATRVQALLEEKTDSFRGTLDTRFSYEFPVVKERAEEEQATAEILLGLRMLGESFDPRLIPYCPGIILEYGQEMFTLYIDDEPLWISKQSVRRDSCERMGRNFGIAMLERGVRDYTITNGVRTRQTTKERVPCYQMPISRVAEFLSGLDDMLDV